MTAPRLLKQVPLFPVLAATFAIGCVRPGGPATTNEFGSDPTVFTTALKCLPVTSAEPLPARSEVTSGQLATATGDVYFTSALFGAFNSICGACHVSGQQGGFVVSEDTFPELVTQAVLDDYIKSPDPNVYMPPKGDPNAKPYSERAPTDPVVELVNLLELWIQQGSPAGSFSLHPATTDAGTSADGADADGPADANDDGDGDADGAPAAGAPEYPLSPALGARLTNIGSCVPDKYSVGLEPAKMDTLDTFFANATELPDSLSDTDLTSFDSDALARTGVISYFPAYPLWSDDAGKMRHVRPPRGQSIALDKATQKFSIPANTRFYKTFFKQVVDASGQTAWKRIETRLIVSRPDTTLADGTVEQTALFGTYVWNESETSAELLKDPLRDGEPFADRLITYVTDEPRAAAITATQPKNLEYALENAGVVRHYALPSSERCIQCHMGSPSAAFVLGFTPLQVATKAPGYSGVIEPALGDELTQLQRLIDYGVVKMTSADDVVPLERSQLPRAPRNDNELRAQAYMVGNCAHCHNPRGFPSTKAPELKDVFDLLPGPDGGIFQFPLDRTSPVRARGANQDVPIPYITPSLRDYLDPVAFGADAPPGLYTPKFIACGGVVDDDGWCQVSEDADFIDAPWRSLIYRNVDTPFDYVDDLTIFPHMPMNTPGYDCRAARIMADWMVSIPAVLANTDKTKKEDSIDPATVDNTPQPYLEVKPGDSGYAAAVTAAQSRLATYHAGHRYSFCPDTSDIVDPSVESGEYETPPDKAIGDFSVSPPRLIMPADGVPDHAHWVVTDDTDPPGDWLPRGTEWPKALLAHEAVVHGAEPPDEAQEVVDALTDVTLDDATRRALLTEIPFGLWQVKAGCDFTGIPTVGSLPRDTAPLWVRGADPNALVYSEAPGAAVFTNICINCHGPLGDAKGLLADEISIMTGGDARVANFRSGLFGPVDAPGANRQRVFGASAIEVLDVDGGPPDAAAPDGESPDAAAPEAEVPDATPPEGEPPDAAPPDVPSPTTGALPDPDDFGARYMAWMALGGTSVTIPPGILTVVSTTAVVGERRQSLLTRASPNMLQLVQELCTHVAPEDVLALTDEFFTSGSAVLGLDFQKHGLIKDNGDTELWLNVCSLNNRPLVRVVTDPNETWALGNQVTLGSAVYYGTGDGSTPGVPYPPDAPVMDHRGHVASGISADNLFPICVRRPADPALAKAADAWVADKSHWVTTPEGPANQIPYCPDQLFATAPGPIDAATGQPTTVSRWAVPTTMDASNNTIYGGIDRWAIRGAINGGLAVFLYVDQMSRGLVQPQILYNQCELLQK
jgi:mono/diheme cytochrome c family protein